MLFCLICISESGIVLPAGCIGTAVSFRFCSGTESSFNLVPHSIQNRDSSSFFVPQFVQYICCTPFLIPVFRIFICLKSFYIFLLYRRKLSCHNIHIRLFWHIPVPVVLIKIIRIFLFGKLISVACIDFVDRPAAKTSGGQCRLHFSL